MGFVPFFPSPNPKLFLFSEWVSCLFEVCKKNLYCCRGVIFLVMSTHCCRKQNNHTECIRFLNLVVLLVCIEWGFDMRFVRLDFPKEEDFLPLSSKLYLGHRALSYWYPIAFLVISAVSVPFSYRPLILLVHVDCSSTHLYQWTSTGV